MGATRAALWTPGQPWTLVSAVDAGDGAGDVVEPLAGEHHPRGAASGSGAHHPVDAHLGGSPLRSHAPVPMSQFRPERWPVPPAWSLLVS